MKFQPIIKWTGTKRFQSEEIISKIPNREYTTYYEPFCGSCSVLFQVLNSDLKFKEYICSDINSDLIELWEIIKNNPKELIKHYENLWNQLKNLENISEKRDFFNKIRKSFNEDRNPMDFMFILRTTTNGLVRYNKNNEFNNSFHLSRNGINPKTLEKVLNNWSFMLNKYNVIFINQSYLNIVPKEDDFIYLDPPYANTKGMYYGGIDLDSLWNFLKNLNCNYILSFDGKTLYKDLTYDVPKELYTESHYLYSGQSSFRRLFKNDENLDVFESIYVKNNMNILKKNKL